jgi:hypothetical protein
MIGLSSAYDAFDEQNRFKDARKSEQVNKLVNSFLAFAAALTKS